MSPHDHPGHPHSWQDHAATYDQDADAMEERLHPVTAALLDAAAVRPGSRLLDLACGPGFVTEAARRRGAAALGIDITPGMVDAARRRFPRSRFAIGDMLDPPPGPWDAITCRLGAHHVPVAWAARAVAGLAPGGRLAIAELGETDASSHGNGMRPPGHWAQALREAGLEDVSVRTVQLAAGAMGGHGRGDGADPLGEGPAHVVAGSKPA